MLDEYELEHSNYNGRIDRYHYLSDEDSDLYNELKDSDDSKDKQIVALILDKARACRAAHCACSY